MHFPPKENAIIQVSPSCKQHQRYDFNFNFSLKKFFSSFLFNTNILLIFVTIYNSRYLQSNGQIPKSNKQENYMITPRTQTAIAVLKCIYARDYGTCIKPCTLTEKEKQALLLQLSIAKFILLKDTENPLEISGI